MNVTPTKEVFFLFRTTIPSVFMGQPFPPPQNN